MKRALELRQLLCELGPSATIEGDDSCVIRGIEHDSRRVKVGDLFVARQGQRARGVDFVTDAVSKGAAAVMATATTEVPSLNVPVLRADNLPLAFGKVASALHNHPSFSLEVIGVTGTNGKTTTTHLIQYAIDAANGAASCGVVGTLGHQFGEFFHTSSFTTPEANELQESLSKMVDLGATHVSMEVSSHALEQGRVLGMQFRVGVFTNLTQDHLDFHGTMQAYAAAKAKLFVECAPSAAVINVDDAFGEELAKTLTIPVIRVSKRQPFADVFLTSCSCSLEGLDMQVRTPSGPIALKTRLVGEHNAENVLITLGVMTALNLDVQRAADALMETKGVAGRLERCDEQPDDPLVLVDYAHTPDALARALQTCRSLTQGRLFVVFGCGGDRDPTKRAPMGCIAAETADVIVVTNDNPRSEDPRSIARAIEEGIRTVSSKHAYSIELDRGRAIAFAVVTAEAGDVVLIAGKGHETHQILGPNTVAFDDRVEATKALRARRTERAQQDRPSA